MATPVTTIESYKEEHKRLKDVIEQKAGKPTEELYEEREKRVRDAIELRQPDRVPVSLRACEEIGYSA